MGNDIYLVLINLTKELLRGGEIDKAKLVAKHLIEKHPEGLDGWLFMVGLSAPHERMIYVAKALEIAPADPRVKKVVAWAQDQIEDVPLRTETAPLRIEDSDQISKTTHLLHKSKKRNKSIKSVFFLLAGIIFALIGIGSIILYVLWFGPSRPQATVSEETLLVFQTTQALIPTFAPSQEPLETTIEPTQIFESTPTATQTPTLTPTPEWMTYDGIDFRDQEVEVLIDMTCGQDQVYLSPFNVVPYSPDIIESGSFYFDLDFSIAWEHLGFYGLWIHSGRSAQTGDLPAYPLQIYLENDQRGFRRYPDEFDQHIQDCLMGSTLRLRQGETISVSEVVAAVRVPPPGVDEVSRHPMDLVPYLAENYPESGFDQMAPPGLLFYFCGRQLTGEAFNNNHDYWTQSRIIIGFMPVEAD